MSERVQWLGKPIKDWEPLFKQKIEIALAVERSDKLVGFTEETDRRVNSVYKMGQDRVHRDEDGTTITISNPAFVNVNPPTLRIDLPIRWLNNQQLHDYSCHVFAQRLAWQETEAVLSSLLSPARNFPIESNTLSSQALTGALTWFSESSHFPDVLLVNPDQKARLEMSGISGGGFSGAWRYPQQVRDSKGVYWAGMLDSLDVYWTAFLDSTTSLLYQKSEVRAIRSPLIVEFGPSYQNPEYLGAREDYLVWPVSDSAISKIIHPTQG